MVSKDSQMQIKHENGYCALYINGKFECNCDTVEEAVKEYELVTRVNDLELSLNKIMKGGNN